jgi:hypothetical protein
MEIVLGVDGRVLVAILSGTLPPAEAGKARGTEIGPSSAFDRRDVDPRRIWLSFSQGLHLRRDGLSSAVESLNMLARRRRKQPPE